MSFSTDHVIFRKGTKSGSTCVSGVNRCFHSKCFTWRNGRTADKRQMNGRKKPVWNLSVLLVGCEMFDNKCFRPYLWDNLFFKIFLKFIFLIFFKIYFFNFFLNLFFKNFKNFFFTIFFKFIFLNLFLIYFFKFYKISAGNCF